MALSKNHIGEQMIIAHDKFESFDPSNGMIQAFKVNKVYNSGKPTEFHALKDIDLKIKEASVTILAGPSGSGKTTLLSIIGAMSRPSSGRVWVKDRDITGLPERFAAEVRRNTFGFIFQNYNLVRGLSVLENVILPSYPLGEKHSRTRDRAMDILKKLNIESKSSLKVGLLSGGEQQRTAIARALINDPSVIIADEPTAHLDGRLSGKLIDIFRMFKEEQKTILIASHDPLVIDSGIVDSVIEMQDGAILNR